MNDLDIKIGSDALRDMARRVAEQRDIRRELQKGYGPLYARINELEHARHGAWRRWKATGRVLGWAYSMGVIAGYGYRYTSSCTGCVSTIAWRGRRLYVLGWKREQWTCLFVGRHLRREMDGTSALCAVCCPCPECGSTETSHWTCDKGVST